MGEPVTCSVCGQQLDGRGPGGLAVVRHAEQHREAFIEDVGRRPHGYGEVRKWWNGELTLTGEQAQIPDFS